MQVKKTEYNRPWIGVIKECVLDVLKENLGTPDIKSADGNDLYLKMLDIANLDDPSYRLITALKYAIIKRVKDASDLKQLQDAFNKEFGGFHCQQAKKTAWDYYTKENLDESDTQTAGGPIHKRTKNEIYALLDKAGFKREGSSPREYMEYYLNGFATAFCMVRLDANENEVLIQRYYDSERMDNMTGRHVEKSIPLPETYSEEFVKQIVKECLKLQRSIRGDESIFGGIDDIPEGFDPQGQGPNGIDMTGNPYEKWNSDMRKLEEGRICTTCNGSGEGKADGTRCLSCGGSGDADSPSRKGKLQSDPDSERDAERDEPRKWSGMNEDFGSSPDTIFKDRQGGRDVYWIDNKDTGGKIFLKPENIPSYIRKGYKIVELEHESAMSEVQGSKSSRNKVMGELRKLLGDKWFLKTTEEFGSSAGGIWTTNEQPSDVLDGHVIYSDVYSDTEFVHPKVKEILDRNGWYVEPYDSGTLMIYPI